MFKLLDCLRQNGPAGIPARDARLLFLWLYCTTGILPPALAGEPLTREKLVSVFSSLVAEGVIDASAPGENLRTREWDDLVDDLLSQLVVLDYASLETSRRYLR